MVVGRGQESIDTAYHRLVTNKLIVIILADETHPPLRTEFDPHTRMATHTRGYADK